MTVNSVQTTSSQIDDSHVSNVPPKNAPPPPPAGTTNGVSGWVGPPPPPPGCSGNPPLPPPATNPNGYAQDPFAELRNDPEYQELMKEIELLTRFEESFAAWDGAWGNGIGGGKGDGLLDWGNISDAAKAGDPTAQEFMRHKRLFDEACGGHSLISAAQLHQMIKSRRSTIKSMESEARAAAASRSQSGTTSNGTTSTSTNNGTQGTKNPEAAQGASSSGATARSEEAKKILAEANDQAPKPPPSQVAGLEGASENMNNMIAWAEGEVDRLTTLMGKTDDPAVLKVLENKINALSRRMQQLSALMNQLTTMMSNISKMYSDIAMNAIRNMR